MSDFNFLEDAVAGLRRFASLGVAVSGGSDSLALLRLLHALGGPELRVATVDHGLRAEAASEAERVAEICADLGLAHECLRWGDWDGTGNLQDQARRARYRLLAEWGQRQGLDAIALGHTMDDQAETFVMRLSRQAGVDGLSQMAVEFQRGGMVFVRPLLGCRRADLRGYLQDLGQDWIDDPSNEDARFDRVKARRALEALRPLGIEAKTLAQVAEHMSGARDALGTLAAGAADRLARLEAGDLVFDRDGFHALPREICRRLIVAALRFISPSDYAPRSQPVSAILDAIGIGKGATLHGVRVLVRAGGVLFTRELSAVQDLAAPTDELWDARWRMHGDHGSDLHTGALGEDGLAFCPDWRNTGIARQSLVASPAIWRDKALISAPIAGFSAGWCAELAQNRDEYVNSLIPY